MGNHHQRTNYWDVKSKKHSIVGMATIGQSPRDDLVPDIKRLGGIEAEIIECGALDGLSSPEIEKLAAKEGEYPLLVRLNDGTPLILSRDRLFPRMQKCVYSLIEKGADVILILCFGEWPPFKSTKLVVRPLEPLCAFILALVDRRDKIGFMVPVAGQVDEFERKLSHEGQTVKAVYASPYSPRALDEVASAAETLKESNIDVVAMVCPGYTLDMKMIVNQITGKPVVLARSMLGYILKELG